jgi:hypothetical protein
MQRVGKSAARQMVIKRGNAESERGLLQAWRAAWLWIQQQAQFGQCTRAALWG